MKGNLCIDTIKYSIQRGRKNDICQYFRNNGYLVTDDRFTGTKRILSTKKKERFSDLNVSICKVRESINRYGTTTTIEFYGLSSYLQNDMEEKFNGYKVFLTYCKENKLLNELDISELHIDLDLYIKPNQILDIKYKHGRGPKKEINKFENIDFNRESYYLNQVNIFKVLYRYKDKVLISIEDFKYLYNSIVKEINKKIDFNSQIGDELKNVRSKNDLLEQYNEHAKRYDSYSEIKDIFQKFKFINPLERINKIFETFEKLDWKNKNIRKQELNKIMQLNNSFQSYHDDNYIYLVRNDFNKFFILGELKDKLNQFDTTISLKSSKSNDLIVYNKKKKEKLNFDMMRFEFKLRTINLNQELSKIEGIHESFKNEFNKYTIKCNYNNKHIEFEYGLEYEHLLKLEIDKYFGYESNI